MYNINQTQSMFSSHVHQKEESILTAIQLKRNKNVTSYIIQQRQTTFARLVTLKEHLLYKFTLLGRKESLQV